ncbi:transporter [Lithospermum erythrorhizon]|uniref:Transporter n=1 Tax=Lithospermum erythrorhizon TaxID=34254 RepID=A0AAV3QGN6_LITER
MNQISSLKTTMAFMVMNLQGMACALETLCGQAFGAKQFKKIGIQTYTAIFSLFLICIPISILWINIKNILIFFGQDPLISHEAGIFITWLLPALFSYAPLHPLVRYFQTQSMIFPLLMSSCFTIIFHVLISWVLVFKSGLGNRGAAIGLALSLWSNATILFFYMRFSPSCEKTRSPITIDIFRGIKEFFHFAIPSAIMVCLEWWSYELIILLSGILPNPQLETSVLSVCLNTILTLYAIPYGLGAAVSTRVSNELGAGNSQRAKIAIIAVMLLIFVEIIVLNTTLYSCRNIFGYVFSSDLEVVQYVSQMTPLLCLTIVLDGLQGALSGIARGCGWQRIGAYVNLAAFYLCGIPMAIMLSFWQNYGGKGLWIGIVSGALVQNSLLSIITFCTNWEKQALKARERLSDEKSPSIVC